MTKDPAARGVAEASLEAYENVDAEFAAALAAFNKNHQTFMAYSAAINTNSALVIQARDEVVGQQNVTDTSKAKLLRYLACPSSSICCQAAEDVPTICAEDAAGTVAKFAAPAEFTLRSPPPPPSPPPSPPPPTPPPSPPPQYAGVVCPSGKFTLNSRRSSYSGDHVCGLSNPDNYNTVTDKLSCGYYQRGSQWFYLSEGRGYNSKAISFYKGSGSRRYCESENAGNIYCSETNWKSSFIMVDKGGGVVSLFNQLAGKWCETTNQGDIACYADSDSDSVMHEWTLGCYHY